jgi:hypothetical protein
VLDKLLADCVTGNEQVDAMLRDLATESNPAMVEPSSPDEFASVDETIPTDHCCPKCGYQWSGGSQ